MTITPGIQWYETEDGGIVFTHKIYHKLSKEELFDLCQMNEVLPDNLVQEIKRCGLLKQFNPLWMASGGTEIK